jgi:hypothetical protein
MRYASERRGGRAVDMEKMAPDDGLRPHWESGVQHFVQVLESDREEAVLEWGFPVNCLALVKSLKENGVRVVWFECPDDEARERYLERGDQPVEWFDAQVRSIRENYERIMEEVDPEIIDLLNPDGSDRSTEELYDLVWPRKKH